MAELIILIPSLRGGGLEKTILRLATELNQQNVDLDFVVTNMVNSAYQVPNKLPFINLDAARIAYALVPLVRYLKKTKPRVLFSAGTPLNSIAVLAKLVSGYPKRLVLGERNHLSSIVRHSSRFRDRFRPYLVRFLYTFANLVLAVSKSVADDVITIGGLDEKKVRVVHNFFDVDQIRVQASVPTNIDWIDTPDVPILISVGRMVPQKGYDILLKAFSLLRKQRECRLVILGDGTERATLEILAKELNVHNDVFMPGFVQNPYAYMAKASLLVQSSLWEGLPGVLIEALACGTPVVAINSPGGASEILAGGKYGTLITTPNVTDLAEAISHNLNNKSDSKKLIDRARFFSSENILQQYKEAFEIME
ncbi:MAG: glycosyltransferase [Candidatus Jacksonbacteria bacterium]|nr:glycosyltransferase [Candidatus Jacksonbacteria bacterium]